MIIDPSPLTSLRELGVRKEELFNLFELFTETLSKELDRLERMVPTTHSSPDSDNTMKRLIHRARSACASMGATTLDLQLQELICCASHEEAIKKIDSIKEIFSCTQVAFSELLKRLTSE
jgi:hypothetical protein